MSWPQQPITIKCHGWTYKLTYSFSHPEGDILQYSLSRHSNWCDPLRLVAQSSQHIPRATYTMVWMFLRQHLALRWASLRVRFLLPVVPSGRLCQVLPMVSGKSSQMRKISDSNGILHCDFAAPNHKPRKCVHDFHRRIQDFPEGTQTRKRCTNLLFGQNLLKTAWKWNKLDRGRKKLYYIHPPLNFLKNEWLKHWCSNDDTQVSPWGNEEVTNLNNCKVKVTESGTDLLRWIPFLFCNDCLIPYSCIRDLKNSNSMKLSMRLQIESRIDMPLQTYIRK